MAFRMSSISDQVRVGINSNGDANIEVWTPSREHPDAQIEEITIPADALEAIGKYLLKAS